MQEPSNDVLAKVWGILSDKIVTQSALAETITPETPLLRSGLGLDSVAVLELVVAIENQFGVTFHDKDLSVDLFKSVESLALAVERKIAAREVPATGGPTA